MDFQAWGVSFIEANCLRKRELCAWIVHRWMPLFGLAESHDYLEKQQLG
jgi:hypothetical protein